METKYSTLPSQAGITEATEDGHFLISTGQCLALLSLEQVLGETGTTVEGSVKPSLTIFIQPLLHFCLPPVPKETTFLSSAQGSCSSVHCESLGGCLGVS